MKTHLAALVCAAPLLAQTTGNLLRDDYHYVLLTTDARGALRSAGGRINLGAAGATQSDGRILVSLSDTAMELRFGDRADVLVGSATDPERYALLVAVRATQSDLTPAVLRGNYAAAWVGERGASAAGLGTAWLEFTADGAGNLSRATVVGHLSALDDVDRKYDIEPAFALARDGAGTLSTGGGEILPARIDLLAAPDGAVLLGYSSDAAHPGILVGLRKASDSWVFSLRGLHWISELYAEDTFAFQPGEARFGAAAGTLRSNGEGRVSLSQRVDSAGRRTHLTTLNGYRIGTDGTATLGQQIRAGVNNFAWGGNDDMFVGAQVGAPGDLSLAHGVFVGLRAPREQPSGVYLSPSGITNSATLEPAPVSAGALLSLFGTNLAADTASSATGVEELGGVKVTIGGSAAHLRLVSPQQINLQAPDNVSGPATTIQVIREGRNSNSVQVPVAASSAGVFSSSGNGTGAALAFHADATAIDNASPALPGETIVLFAAGLGQANPELRVLFGGLPGEITFAGQVPGFAGYYQINVVVPQDAAPAAGTTPLAVATSDSFTDLTDIPVRR